MKGCVMAGVKNYTVLGIIVLLLVGPCVVIASLQSDFDALPDGSIVAWGNDDDMQVRDVPEFSDFKAVAAGANHSLAVRADGSLVAWGDNSNGETDVPKGGGYVAVAVGWNHSLALHSDGSVRSWGLTGSPPDPNSNFVAIAAGIDFSLGLKADGSLVGWGGGNVHGQRTIPALAVGEKYKAIAAGGYHGLAIVTDSDPQTADRLAAWGWDFFDLDTVPPGWETGDFRAIGAGTYHNVSLEADGTINVWGNVNAMSSVPSIEPGGFKSVACGEGYSVALRNNGSIEVWGDIAMDPRLVNAIPAGDIYKVVSAGRNHVLALADPPIRVITPNGAEFLSADTTFTITWETQSGIDDVIIDLSTDFGATYLPEYSVRVPNSTRSYAWQIPVVNSAVCRIRISDADDPNRYDESDHPFTVYPPNVGVIVGWGDDSHLKASDVPATHHCDKLAAGHEHSLALLTDGSIRGWGRTDFGLDLIPADPNYIDIAAGEAFSIALHQNGAITCWGSNIDGQAAPPTEWDYTQVAAGDYHGLAINRSGDVIGWGKGDQGAAYASDMQAYDKMGINAIAIAAGGNQSLAIIEDGSLLAWGNNDYGQWTEPTGSYAAGNGFIAVASGRFHHVALREDKSLVAWGNTSAAPAGNDFVAIAAGDSFSLALREDGTIEGWGFDTFGQISVPRGYDFFKIAAGQKHALAFGNPAFTITAPAKGELLRAGSLYSLQWLTHAISSGKATHVNLFYSIDDGAIWTAINPDSDGDEDEDPDPVANVNQYENWLLPQVTSQTCRIKLQDGDLPDVEMVSAAFTLYQCTLTLDANEDCQVDLLDFALFVSQWLHCGNPFDQGCYNAIVPPE
ncbi:MAG: hypothetical protein K9M57_05260 [Phycisphaerae bacterium]|nr:hypothetical protein [Phycisphaerae bacterium]